MPDISFSKTYLHELRELYRQHEGKLITDVELSQRSDELKEIEAKQHEHIGRLLLMEHLGEAEKEIENEVKQESQQRQQEFEARERAKQIEQTQQLQKLQREQQLEVQRLRQIERKKLAAQNNFRGEVDDYINRLEADAQKWQTRYTQLQLVLLFFSTLTATMASVEVVPRLVVSISGFIAAIAGGILTTFKIQDRIYASRKAVAQVRQECQKYDYHIDEYANLNAERAFIRFSGIINEIQGQQMLQEVELWNPSKEESKEGQKIQSDVNQDQEEKVPNEIVPQVIPQEEKLSDNIVTDNEN